MLKPEFYSSYIQYVCPKCFRIGSKRLSGTTIPNPIYNCRYCGHKEKIMRLGFIVEGKMAKTKEPEPKVEKFDSWANIRCIEQYMVGIGYKPREASRAVCAALRSNDNISSKEELFRLAVLEHDKQTKTDEA